MPQEDEMASPHLRSRREVEAVLRSRSVPVTVLRAGLIFGAGGSSFSMLVNLVRRLPVMIFPAWVNRTTHSIDIENVMQAIEVCLQDPDLHGGIYDLGGHDPMTYRDMIVRTAERLGKKVRSIEIPYNCINMSKRWVALFSGVPLALVAPLQESLRHNLQAQGNPLLERLKGKLVPFEESLARGVQPCGSPKQHPRKKAEATDRRQLKTERRVRSVQRMMLPRGWDAQQIAAEYGSWLSRKFGGLLNAERDENGVVRFIAMGNWFPLLELTPTPYTVGNKRRCAFYVSGGALSRKVDPQGRFEFRLFPENDCLIASIHGFAPVLPWAVYSLTQAQVHLAVMRAFGRHLERLDQEGSQPPLTAAPFPAREDQRAEAQ